MFKINEGLSQQLRDFEHAIKLSRLEKQTFEEIVCSAAELSQMFLKEQTEFYQYCQRPFGFFRKLGYIFHGDWDFKEQVPKSLVAQDILLQQQIKTFCRLQNKYLKNLYVMPHSFIHFSVGSKKINLLKNHLSLFEGFLKRQDNFVGAKRFFNVLKDNILQKITEVKEANLLQAFARDSNPQMKDISLLQFYIENLKDDSKSSFTKKLPKKLLPVLDTLLLKGLELSDVESKKAIFCIEKIYFFGTNEQKSNVDSYLEEFCLSCVDKEIHSVESILIAARDKTLIERFRFLQQQKTIETLDNAAKSKKYEDSQNISVSKPLVQKDTEEKPEAVEAPMPEKPQEISKISEVEQRLSEIDMLKQQFEASFKSLDEQSLAAISNKFEYTPVKRLQQLRDRMIQENVIDVAKLELNDMDRSFLGLCKISGFQQLKFFMNNRKDHKPLCGLINANAEMYRAAQEVLNSSASTLTANIDAFHANFNQSTQQRLLK